MKHSHEDLQYYKIDLIDKLIDNVSKEEGLSSLIEKVLVQPIEEIGEDGDKVEVNKLALQLQAPQLEHAYKFFKELGGSVEEKPTNLELKQFSEHLKYVFLSQGNRHSTIISRRRRRKIITSTKRK